MPDNERKVWITTANGQRLPAIATAATPTLEDAITNRNIAVIRIRYHHNRNGNAYHRLDAWTPDHYRIWFNPYDHNEDDAVRDDMAETLMAEYPHIDWTRDHDIHLADGAIHGSPQAWEHGFIPEDDLSYGPPKPATYKQATP
jgi:hypothetical protein